jgi:hypothetical protein
MSINQRKKNYWTFYVESNIEMNVNVLHSDNYCPHVRFRRCLYTLRSLFCIHKLANFLYLKMTVTKNSTTLYNFCHELNN